MGKRGKRKKRSSDSEGSFGQSRRRTITSGGPPEGEVSVSEILSQTNSVLYHVDQVDQADHLEYSDSDIHNDSVFSPHLESSGVGVNTMEGASHSQSQASQSTSGEKSSGSQSSKSASQSQPSNMDIMRCLKGIESRLGVMDKRLDALEEVKNKFTAFDIEIRKLWRALEDRTKKVEDRVIRVEERVESSDFAIGVVNEKVISLEKERDRLKDEVVYLQSQSMRNNLIFSNIPESQLESNEDAERKVREFIVEKMKLAQEAVDRMTMERVHRIGPKQPGRCRNLVAKFLEYKDKELVRKQWKSLQGTPYYVNEQFPREVIEKRKKLYPKMKAARQQGKTAWVSYDTLYIDGKAVRD